MGLQVEVLVQVLLPLCCSGELPTTAAVGLRGKGGVGFTCRSKVVLCRRLFSEQCAGQVAPSV